MRGCVDLSFCILPFPACLGSRPLPTPQSQFCSTLPSLSAFICTSLTLEKYLIFMLKLAITIGICCLGLNHGMLLISQYHGFFKINVTKDILSQSSSSSHHHLPSPLASVHLFSTSLSLVLLCKGFPDSSVGKESQFNSLVRKIRWRRDKLPTLVFLGFPGGSVSKESACSAGDLDSISGLGRSPGGQHGNPLQYSCVENPHGQMSLVGYSPLGRKESDMTERLSRAQHLSF